jgi:glycosyltransferase involved in cell wall biosynthesis
MAKKKILLLSDDIRIHSGVGTMSKSFVLGTINKYDWVQMAGAIKHPELGKVADLSDDIKKNQNIADAYCKLYPVNGYGDQQTLRTIIDIEKPDAIMHFTDPRFWGWLYAMEAEIRQTIPIMYYNIWDDLPYPHWNENAYESCDALMAISKQTYNINRQVCQRKHRVEGKDLFYVQHGINENTFYPILGKNEEYEKFAQDVLQGRTFDFIAFFNSRNIRRKGISDLISAFASFTKKLNVNEKSALILHTDPVDENGTDLPALIAGLYPNLNVVFSTQKLAPQHMNYMYNIADIVCNPSSAEGFGLSHMEALMAGKPTIATVLGGLQDQMGFKVDGREITTDDFTAEIGSNSTGKISTEHGEWVYPIWPNQSLQGSVPTPYIYDSRPAIEDIAAGLEFWYKQSKSERVRKGISGRNWAIDNKFTEDGMNEAMGDAIQTCLDNFKPKPSYELIDTSKPKVAYPTGVLK